MGLREQVGPHLSPVFVSTFTGTVPIEWTSCPHHLLADTMPAPKAALGRGAHVRPSLGSQLGQWCCRVDEDWV